MSQWLLTLGLRYPLPVVLFLAAVSLFSAAGLGKLGVDTSFDSLIPSHDRSRVVYQRLVDQFGSDNQTLVYIRDPGLWTPGSLQALDRLQRALQGVPDISRVESLFSLRNLERHEGEILSRLLLPDLPQRSDEIDELRRRALANPLYLGTLLSADGLTTAIVLSHRNHDDRPDFNQRTFDAIEALLLEHGGDFEEIFQVGAPRIHSELTASLFSDLRLLGPLAALVLVAIITLFLRNALASILPLATSLLSIVWTFGLLGWAGIPLNILSAMVPALVVVIGSTEDTHLMAAYLRGLKQGAVHPRRSATLYLVRHAGLPLLLTVATTVLGFASNLFNDMLLIRDFAITAALAMLANGIITILLVPLLLSRFGPARRPRGLDANASARLPESIVRGIHHLHQRAPMQILMATAALSLFFAYHATQLQVNINPLAYFSHDRPLPRHSEQIHRDLAGIHLFYVALDGGHEGAFLEPENLARLDAIQHFIDSQGVFDRSLSLADYLALLHSLFNDHEYARDRLPDSRQLAAQYLLFLHRNDIEAHVSHDFRVANILVRHNLGDSHRLGEHVDRLQGFLHEVTPPGMRSTVTGEGLLLNRAAESLLIDQVKALLVLLLLIFLIMSVMFTSLKGGVIALIPALIPIVFIFGAMGLLGIPLSPGTAMVAVVSVGIAVDGTIHLLARYNELCRRTSDYVGAVETAVREVAAPLIVSSLALALGFAVLLLSGFTIVAQFGMLAAATIVLSLLANLLITPIIMARVRLIGLYQILTLQIDRNALERSSLFDNMTEYQRRKAVLISEFNEFEAGERLIEQGAVGRSMYLILSGEVEVVRHTDAGSEALKRLGPGEIFGEIGFLSETTRSADVHALSAVSALRFDYQRMQKDLKLFPGIAAKLNFNITRILKARMQASETG